MTEKSLWKNGIVSSRTIPKPLYDILNKTAPLPTIQLSARTSGWKMDALSAWANEQPFGAEMFIPLKYAEQEAPKMLEDIDPYVRLKDFLPYIGIKRSTVWSWIKKGKFPPPEKKSSITVWRKSQIVAWLKGC